MFYESELAFVRAVAPQLADGARRALLLAEASEAERPDEPGLIVVTERWEIESATPGVERWLARLPDGDVATGRLPSVHTGPCRPSLAYRGVPRSSQRGRGVTR